MASASTSEAARIQQEIAALTGKIRTAQFRPNKPHFWLQEPSTDTRPDQLLYLLDTRQAAGVIRISIPITSHLQRSRSPHQTTNHIHHQRITNQSRQPFQLQDRLRRGTSSSVVSRSSRQDVLSFVKTVRILFLIPHGCFPVTHFTSSIRTFYRQGSASITDKLAYRSI